MKRLNKKGFTMAELLIVVAIIAVLVAIAIPVFTAQLEKSREAVDAANIRSAYAEAMADYLTNGSTTGVSKETAAAKSTGAWDTNPDFDAKLKAAVPSSVTQGTKFTVSIADDGKVTVTQGSSSSTPSNP